jgi:hypothetical protein
MQRALRRAGSICYASLVPDAAVETPRRLPHSMPRHRQPQVSHTVSTSQPAATGAKRWLLFVHQVPSQPSNLRVRTWRRLQQLGAIAVKQAVYVLPESPGALEDFQWLKTEIESAGGQASVFAADSVDSWSDDAIIREFRLSRQRAYGELAAEVERVLRRPGSRRRSSSRNAAPPRLLEAFRERVAAIDRVDFFGSAGRDRVVTLIEQLASEQAQSSRRPSKVEAAHDPRNKPRGALWVTRPRPGVDRMASAWLIRRFIDTRARFAFVPDPAAAPVHAIPFDMFGVEFSHHAEHCTFETLCEHFGIRDGAVTRMAEIVHDLDLKDSRFEPSEAPTIGLLIDGLQLGTDKDDELLGRGMMLFDALHRSLEHDLRAKGARPAGRRRAAAKKR